MREPKYSSVDPDSGNIRYDGPLEITNGDHKGMCPRTDMYLPGTERGHVCASSLSPYAVNNTLNVGPQYYDLNHKSWLHTESGERNALKSGASVHSEKVAYVDAYPGCAPNNFSVNDRITYPNGYTEQVHYSFTNESYATQELFNEMSASLPGTYDGVNPGDHLRTELDPAQYAELMQSSDALLPGIETDYMPADYSGLPASVTASSEMEAADIDTHVAETNASIEELATDCSNVI